MKVNLRDMVSPTWPVKIILCLLWLQGRFVRFKEINPNDVMVMSSILSQLGLGDYKIYNKKLHNKVARLPPKTLQHFVTFLCWFAQADIFI